MINIREIARQSAEAKYLRPSSTKEYVLDGTTDLLQAQLEILIYAPNTDTVLDTDENEIEIFRDTVKIEEAPGGGGVWHATVKYSETADRTELNLNFGVQSSKIYQANSTVKVYDCITGASGPDGTMPNVPAFRGAIGANGDEVEGCEVEVTKVEFSIKKHWARDVLDPSYYDLLFQFTRPRTAVNDATYSLNILGQGLLFPTGSLRLRGFQTRVNNFNETEIEYQFAYEGPITAADNFTVGSSAVIEKEGWQYLWIYYKKIASNNVTTHRPVGVIINNVYPYKDFGLLEIDT